MWVPNTCDSNVPSDPTAGSRFRAQSSPPGLRDWRSGRRRPPRHTRSDGRRPVRQLETGAAPQMFDVRQPPRELSEDATEVQPKTKVVREVLPALRHPAADATDPALRPAQALPRLVSLALGVATHHGGSIARFRRRIVRLMASPTCNGRAMRDGRFYDIVAVPTTHALRSTKIVLLRDLFASDLATMSTSSLIVTSSSVPKLRGSRWSEAPCK